MIGIISTEQELKGALSEALPSQSGVTDDKKLNVVASVVNPEAACFLTGFGGEGQVSIPAYIAYVLDREGIVTEFPVITGVSDNNEAAALTGVVESLSDIYRKGNPLFNAAAAFIFSEAGILSEVHEELTEDMETPGPVLLGGGMVLHRGNSERLQGADYVGTCFAEAIGGIFDSGDLSGVDREMIDYMLTTLATPQAEAMKPLLDIYDADEVMVLMQSKTMLQVMATQAIRNSLGVISTPKVLRPRISN